VFQAYFHIVFSDEWKTFEACVQAVNGTAPFDDRGVKLPFFVLFNHFGDLIGDGEESVLSGVDSFDYILADVEFIEVVISEVLALRGVMGGLKMREDAESNWEKHCVKSHFFLWEGGFDDFFHPG